jgi:aryl-alcohol dehydrogenase-like predicted oxidoreductase
VRPALGRSGQHQKVLNRSSIRAEIEFSLRRLSVDVIDLYQIHWPPDPDSSALEEGWSTLAELKGEGKVRWIGVSNVNVQTTTPRAGHRSRNVSAASVFSAASRDRRSSSALLRAGRNWSHRLFPHGFRSSNRRHDS